jgi:hypothetical protein
MAILVAAKVERALQTARTILWRFYASAASLIGVFFAVLLAAKYPHAKTSPDT